LGGNFLRKKKIVLALTSIAVLIPLASGISIVISNSLSGTFSVNGLPISINWVSEDLNNVAIDAETTTTCEIGIKNWTPQNYPDACIVLVIDTPTPHWQFSCNEISPIACQADEYLSGTTVRYTMPIPITADFDGTMTFDLVFGENCAPGNYQFRIEAYSEM